MKESEYMEQKELKNLLKQVAKGTIDIQSAMNKFKNQPFEDLGFAKADIYRLIRQGIGIEEIGAEEIIVSSINVGKGQVRCAHGTLPVPAPATSYILKDVPIYSNEINGELCTPTGAALLKYFAKEFSNMPLMKIQKIGYGMGTKDFETANCVRVILGETEDKNIDTITELCFNIDDMTGEQIGYALREITEAGALDVFTTAINMKKNRPAVMITCLCRETEKEKIEIETNYGKINAKKSTGYGTEKIKAEYEDLAKIAKKNNISIMDIKIESDIDD